MSGNRALQLSSIQVATVVAVVVAAEAEAAVIAGGEVVVEAAAEVVLVKIKATAVVLTVGNHLMACAIDSLSL